MPLQIIREDITRLHCDAIVNAANTRLCGGGGVNGAIHRAAGHGLDKACRALDGCEVGQARITDGFALPCRYIIHTVGPRWQGGDHGEAALLASCYRESLALALAHGCASVAFPLISSGMFGYPKDQALHIAVEEISRFLAEHEMQVTIAVFDRDGFESGQKLFPDIQSYIDDHYVSEQPDRRHYANDINIVESRKRRRRGEESEKRCFRRKSYRKLTEQADDSAIEEAEPFPADERPLPEEEAVHPAEKATSPADEAAFSARGAAHPAGATLFSALPACGAVRPDLDQMLRMLDESFSEMLLRKIDERGMRDAECYKKANIDRRLFSKIRSDAHYRPSKPTVLAFAIALELSLDETKEMLMKAGFALSHSDKADVIVEYFIRRGCYDIFEINEALFAFDQSLLGS